jgi:hypothetical protein
MTTGSGSIAQETRPLAEWSSVNLACPGRLELETGPNQGIAIEADDNILPLIETLVDDGRLTIRFKPSLGSIRPVTSIMFRAATPAIDAMTVSGTGSIHSGPIARPELTLAVSGSGSVSVQSLETGRLVAGISGSGTVAVRGTAEEQAIRISGSGSLDARDLASQRAEVTLSGSGSAMVRVEQSITGRISGSGSVIYAGQPSTSVRTSGSGRVVQMPT